MKFDGNNRPIMFKLVRFVTLDDMTCVSLGANALSSTPECGLQNS